MRILITGGTKGLGLATAARFAQEKADLLLTFRSDEAGAKEAAGSLLRAGARSCEVFGCDLTEEAAIGRLWDWVESKGGGLDSYIHNAAATAFKDLLDIQGHHIDKTMNLTVKSFILALPRLVKLMPKGGTVVTVSGMDTLKAVARHSLLGAAKAALETLTAYASHELGDKGIRVNSVNPGFFASDSTRKYLGPAFEMVNKAFAEATPVGREPRLEEIAEVIAFLALPKSSWVVGQTIVVDGGFDFALPPLG